ncbi:retrovirus-related pol polyprotein from transposon TNT 1-94 [Tanacetum coccineum]
MRSFQTKQSVNKTNVSDGLFKQVTQQNLPQNRNQAIRNTNVLKPGMFRITSTTTQNRTPQLPHASRNTNPHMSKSSGVIHNTSVSRPQLKCYQVKDKVVPNNSQVKFQKKDALVNPEKNGTNLLPTPIKTVASDTTIQKYKSYYKEVCMKYKSGHGTGVAKRCHQFIHDTKQIRTKKIWMAKIRKDDESTSISSHYDIVSRKLMFKPRSSEQWRLLKITLQAPFLNVKMTFEHNSSSLGHQCQMASAENNTSGPVPQSLVPQGQKASDYDNSDPVPPRQNVVPTVEKTDLSQQGLEFLFSPLLEEYYNPTHGTRNCRSSIRQVVEITMPVQTRRQLATDPEMCMFALTVSIVEPKNIKEAMADSAWIEAMQDELHQFDRLKVWELVDKPFGKMIIKLKWLWKNKKDEIDCNSQPKHDLLHKGYAQGRGRDHAPGMPLFTRKKHFWRDTVPLVNKTCRSGCQRNKLHCAMSSSRGRVRGVICQVVLKYVDEEQFKIMASTTTKYRLLRLQSAIAISCNQYKFANKAHHTRSFS